MHLEECGSAKSLTGYNKAYMTTCTLQLYEATTSLYSAWQPHLKLCLHLEVVISHKRVLWSRLQLATKSPRSWKATPHTA